jgi:uncharacterized protein YqeY
MAEALLKKRIFEDMKSAMRARDKARLSTIRMILAAIKQQEVDTREDVSGNDVIVLLDKMSKQRKDSITQYEAASREDLAEIERRELDLLQTYLPQPLTETEIAILLEEAITATEASSMRDMGKIMAYMKPKVQGRADMGKLSGLVKAKLMS